MDLYPWGYYKKIQEEKLWAASINISPFSDDVELAEAYAFLQGIKLPIDFGLTPLIEEFDSINVVNLIDGSLSSKKEIDWLVLEIKCLMINRAPTIVKHEPRSCNVVA